MFLDPPDHDRLRALLGRAFTPRQVARVRPITRADRGAPRGRGRGAREVDLYDAFAQRLPLQVICEMLGIPSVDHEQVHELDGGALARHRLPDAGGARRAPTPR